MKYIISNINIVMWSENDTLVNINAKSIAFGSGKNPDPNDVKWSTSNAVIRLDVFLIWKKWKKKD